MTPAASVREQTLLLCCLIGTVQMTWGAIVPAMPLYLHHHGLAVETLGVLLAAFAIGRAVVNTPAGTALRWWRPRPYLWVVSLGLVATTSVTGLVSSVPAVIGLRLVAGVLGGAAVTVAFAVLVTAAPADRRGSVVATSMAVMMSAAAVGAVIGGVVVERLGIGWTFVAAAMPLAACLVWELFRPAMTYWAAYDEAGPSDGRPAPDGGEPAVPEKGTARRSRRNLLAALCGVSFATFFVRFAGEQGLVPVMAYRDAGLTPTTLAVAMATGTLVSLACTPAFGRLVDGDAHVQLLIGGSLVGGAAIAILPVADLPLGFGAALVAYFAATTAVNVVPGVVTGQTWGARDSGAVVGLTRTVGDVGAAAGPLCVFWIAGRTSAGAACLMMAALLVAAAGALAALLRARAAPVPAENRS